MTIKTMADYREYRAWLGHMSSRWVDELSRNERREIMESDAEGLEYCLFALAYRLRAVGQELLDVVLGGDT